MNTELIKRIKSLAWRTGMVALAAGITYLATPDTLSGLGLPEVSVAFLGLILGEVSKHLNNRHTK